MCLHLQQTRGGGINLPLPIYGVPYVWIFEKYGRELKVQIEGQLVFNNIALSLNAALAGRLVQLQRHICGARAEHALVRLLKAR